MKRIGLSILAAWLLASCAPALAQTPQLGRLCVGTAASCIPVSVANPFPVSGTFSATLGGFLPSLSYGTLTATAASSASTALPTNTGTVAFQNQNAVAVSCTLAAGAATATTNEIIVPAGSTVFVATTGYDHAACINQTGSASNVIAMAGGSGLGTGFGGGSSGGGGLSVTDQAAWTQASSAFTPGGGVFNDAATLSSGQEGTFRMTTKRAQIMDVDTTGNALYSAITAPIPAGTNLIGKVGIDQTTPGTTNGVQVNAALPAGTNVLGKVSIDQTTPGTTNLVALAANQSVNLAQVGGVATPVGSGVQATAPRMTLATDSPGIVTLGATTKSASVPVAWATDQVGTAGTANASVVTVQGIASMTPIVANSTNGYPSGAIAETASATGTTAATTATLAASVGKTTYICGFSMRSVATAAAAGNATVTGTITGTLNFTHGTGATPTVVPNDQRFNPCVPASATNTAIAVVSPAAGTGGVMSVTAWGFQL